MQVLGCIGYSSTDNFDVVWFFRFIIIRYVEELLIEHDAVEVLYSSLITQFKQKTQA